MGRYLVHLGRVIYLDLQLPSEVLWLTQEMFHAIEDAVGVDGFLVEESLELPLLVQRLILK